MFWKKVKRFEDQVRVVGVQAVDYAGTNRRAVNLIPLPVASDGHEIAQTQSVRFHHLLVSIEGNLRTCCLKIISPRKKSRSAILIFRGRVVGCLYGRKSLGFQVMQQDAQMHALADLAAPGNILDAYQLPEELVLAAASLFHGQVLTFSAGATAEQLLTAAVQQIGSFSLPGCVVVNTDEDEMVCQVYMSGGKIIGVFSSQDGWVEPTLQAALSYLASSGNCKVMASVLAIRTVDDASALGFSLTGLGDRRFQLIRQEGRNLCPVDSVDDPFSTQYLDNLLARYLPYGKNKGTSGRQNEPLAPVPENQQYSRMRRINDSSAVRHAHSINP